MVLRWIPPACSGGDSLEDGCQRIARGGIVRPVTIVYVSDMEDSLGFYRTLLPQAELVATSPYWTELSLGAASVALHISDDIGEGTQLGLALAADTPLEDIAAMLEANEIAIDRPIEDEPFGRSMVIRDLDGLAIQINEHTT